MRKHFRIRTLTLNIEKIQIAPLIRNLARTTSKSTQTGRRLHAREDKARNLWTSLSEVLSSADYIFSYLHTKLHDESYCCYHVETARGMTQFYQTLKGFSPPTYKKSCDVSLPNSGKVMAAVRTADISFQHTCSLFRENRAIERNSLGSLQRKSHAAKLKILRKALAARTVLGTGSMQRMLYNSKIKKTTNIV